MIPTKIFVSAKVSRNFQTYEVGIEGTVDSEEQKDIEYTIRKVQAQCRKLAKEQIAIDMPSVERLKWDSVLIAEICFKTINSFVVVIFEDTNHFLTQILILQK